MEEQNTSGGIPVTLHLSAELAARLERAANAQKRAAADVAVALLDRHLPRPSTAGPKQGSIPYS